MATSPAPRADQGTVLRFGDCELHVLTHELWRQGQQQPIRRRVFELMLLLIQRRPAVVSHAEIAKAVWGRADVRPSLVAQAMMKARQATGAEGDAATHFVSVRGVGYRFASAVTDGAQAVAHTQQHTELPELHATLADAEAALNALDHQRAQFLADRALAMARAAGIHREQTRVLAFAAQVAMQRGSLDQVASLATQGLQLAESEGHPHWAAVSRVRLAWARIGAGDVHGALDQLKLAHVHLDAPEMLAEKRRCEWVMSMAYRELAQFDQALAWCARARVTAQLADKTPHPMSEWTLEVETHLIQGAALANQGRTLDAAASYQCALDLNERMTEAALAGQARARLCMLGNRCTALAGLGRLAEAWQAADVFAQALEAWPEKEGPHYQRWRAVFQGQRASLLAQARRFEEAQAEVQQALQRAQTAGLRNELPGLLAQAVQVCELADNHKQALDWMRQRQAALAELQSERAATLATVLQAEVQADTLRHELRRAREQAQQLALENHVLTQRLSHLAHARLLDEAGFTDTQFLRSTLTHRHTDARQRDVPFCLVLLAIDNIEDLVKHGETAGLTELLRELAKRLAELLAPDQHMVRWRSGHLLFALEHMGARRAMAVCRNLERQLNAMAWPGTAADPGGLKPEFSIRCTDAAQDDKLDTALERMRQQLEAARQHKTASR